MQITAIVPINLATRGLQSGEHAHVRDSVDNFVEPSAASRQPQRSSLIFPAISGGIRWYQTSSTIATSEIPVNESIRANLASSRTSRLTRAIAGRSIRGCFFRIERTDERTLSALPAKPVGSQF